MVNTGFQYDPKTILDNEDAYPHIWDDLMTELWQRRLIKDQINPE